MASSEITKKALSNSLKELLTKKPLNKVNVSEICDNCKINRKTFYYHFKDKEDLVNWIFDSELAEVANQEADVESLNGIERVVEYFYENRGFYRKVLRIEGQNSFSEHFRDLCCALLMERLKKIFKSSDITDFQVNFYADGITCALKRWLTTSNCLTPEEFMSQIRSCIRLTAIHIYENMDEYNLK